MLTSFFSNSKPIHYVLLSVIWIVGFFVLQWTSTSAPVVETNWLYLITAITGVFVLLLFDFIIRKNAITRINTYALFVCTFGFLFCYPALLKLSVLGALVFSLLAVRRIFSLSSNRNTEKKILDASLYITIASFFDTGMLCLFLLLYTAITQKSETSWRHFLIPPIGMGSALVLYSVVFLVFTNEETSFYIWDVLAFSQDTIFSSAVFYAITIPFVMGLLYKIFILSSLQKKEKKVAVLVLVYALVSLSIVFLSSAEVIEGFVYVVPSLAMLLATIIEGKTTTQNKKWWWTKEIILWLWALCPLLSIVL